MYGILIAIKQWALNTQRTTESLDYHQALEQLINAIDEVRRYMKEY